MRYGKEKLGKWALVTKESLFAYARTLVVIWHSGSLAVLGMMLLTLSLGVVPACQFFVTEQLVNAITDAIGDSNWWHQVVPWLIGLLGLQIFSIFANQLQDPLYTHLGENIEIWINEGIARKANKTELIELQAREFQNALERARSVSGLILQNTLWYIVDSIQQLISVITLGTVLWRYQPLLALLPALTGIASWWSGSRLTADLYSFNVKQTPQRRERNALEEILMGRRAGKEVRLYQAQDVWIGHWQRLGQALIQGQEAIKRPKFFVCLGLDIIRGLLYACSLVFLLLEVFREGLTVGTYIAAAVALVQLDSIWNAVANQLQSITEEVRPLFGDLYQFLDRPSASVPQKSPGSTTIQITRVRGNRSDVIEDIVVRNVSFRYPNLEKPVLKHINLTFKVGQRVALVGPNGAGKTTLARLLLGLYYPYTGEIRVGSVSLDAKHRQQWFRHCSAVFQDYMQYHLTARDNIIFGDLDHPERMEEASTAADATSVVDGLMASYDTILGPTFGGQDLSGGEWQRLATARSFMRETPWLVILDEPAATLDPLAERVIYERFIERSAERTSVLISHRLSSVRTCDRILVLDNGAIIEDGSHETLLAKGGLYAQLFKAQSQWYV